MSRLEASAGGAPALHEAVSGIRGPYFAVMTVSEEAQTVRPRSQPPVRNSPTSMRKAKWRLRTSQDSKRDQPRPEQKELCQGCGRTRHTRDKCMLSTHPDFNKNGKWADSSTLRAIKARLQSPSDWVLSFKTRADGSDTDRSKFRTKRSKGTTLATKDPGKWRTTVDFRNLNDASEARHWAMPNIGETLRNIGRKAFKGTLDLTSGYHQAPLSKDCQLYTAFICCLGIFCWTRLPMGLKGAAAYFQQILATIVLVGLIHVVCALYIDDCIVYGDSEEEFVSNLEKVLQAVQAKNISLNPAKCKLGLETIEYVGHTLSREGLHFTDDKLAGVRNFPKPTTAKRLKMFVGLANEDEESTARRKRPRNKKSKEETRTSQDRKRDQPRPEQKELCQGCGRTGHTRETCTLSTHPDFNKNGKWADSAALRAIKARLQSPLDWVLSFKTRADGCDR